MGCRSGRFPSAPSRQAKLLPLPRSCWFGQDSESVEMSSRSSYYWADPSIFNSPALASPPWAPLLTASPSFGCPYIAGHRNQVLCPELSARCHFLQRKHYSATEVKNRAFASHCLDSNSLLAVCPSASHFTTLRLFPHL